MLSDELLLKVSELKSVYPDLEELLNRVEQEQNLFLSNISHELRNALTLMSSSLQYIEASHPEIQDYKYWKETKHDCRYMQSLVHNMSDYTNGTADCVFLRRSWKFRNGAFLRAASYIPWKSGI